MLAGYRRAGHRSVALALRARPCWNNTSRALARRLTVYEVACLCGALRAAAGLLRGAPARLKEVTAQDRGRLSKYERLYSSVGHKRKYAH
ncbi:hypothetical protein MSG28_004398 [Choristoneura fumiferana]|uniref:Uncharacterized protein n=1 Tax=Choristoneura fumiferana TaxID=7141 RepID=A0ACC0KIN6_CHOFU|nr:hypothetical protein MSG28_004398 [Choristoneura fumiferana]